MARGKGNVHKMHDGYKRHQHRTSTPQLLALANQEETERARELMFEDMAADEERESMYDALFGVDDATDEQPECDFGFDDSPYGGFSFELDPFDRDDDYSFEPRPEDSWQKNDQYDAGDRAIGTLRYYMEDVKPDEISSKDVGWIASKYTFLSAMVLGGSFAGELFEEPTAIFGRYTIALEQKLREAQIEFKTYHGLTEKGWQTLKEFHIPGENNLEMNGVHC
ncbi:MAG: hypothetical protein US57_C0009G0025 [Candidatus Moranbacteria bacterium GW2011_GWC2_37_73]|nr:MAG: hypothetical protein UR95_C0005G0017 [Parcubacteria group bacterium GW2011_GWC1_36_108]KKQ00938.1 MAG: hypothetical protein US09_C0004G0001 [Candidatus Moranbacteria bacterium GW2011_GWD1_36_198]KKQ01443.1 MAG: hypothetical protein US10_C0013G0018 [Candidatus Moranbacteria bacterium GW2011_GWD2_36_198]KKQ39781.1 MAG: hypothetical protein US57_C0009G0025 [Candidatus Moranbacteria bacterium GW2011_GWC2_37_73]HAR99763.1 hypothetical protein [Candidatus Moranbacteria bacterium]